MNKLPLFLTLILLPLALLSAPLWFLFHQKPHSDNNATPSPLQNPQATLPIEEIAPQKRKIAQSQEIKVLLSPPSKSFSSSTEKNKP